MSTHLMSGPLEWLPDDLLERLQRLLVTAAAVTELDRDDERELAAAMALLIDDAVTWRQVPAPYGQLLEAADRIILRMLALKAVRLFRRRWGRLSAEHRSRILTQLHQSAQELEL